MRDDQIYKMTQSQEDRFSLLYRQFLFLKSRMDAYEGALSSRRLVLAAVVFGPKWLRAAVDKIQLDLIREHDANMREVAQKRQEEANKPKINVVKSFNGKLMVALCLGIFSGCVTKARYVRDLEIAKLQTRESVEAQCNKVISTANYQLGELHGQLAEKEAQLQKAVKRKK